jgi:cyclohexanone monooxygenase
MVRTVWNTGGCANWYLDDPGRNTLLWPRTTVTMRRQLRSFDAEAYDVAPARSTNDAGKVTA